MPGKYVRKRRYRRSSKKTLRRRPSVRKLFKTVRKLSRRSRLNHQTLLYQTVQSISSVGTAPAVANLCDYAQITTTPVFGTNASISANTVIHRKVKMDLYVTLENFGGGIYGNETSTVQFTFFLVSLRDSINNGITFNPSTGGLVLNAGTHYAANLVGGGAGGLIMLNTKIFKIHKMKKFVLSNKGTALNASAAQTQDGTDKRWSWTQRMAGYVKNPLGSWATLRSAMDPSKQYYLLYFTDNLLLDAESPQVQYNAVHSFTTLN